MANNDLEIIYAQLKDKYDLFLSNTFSLDDRWPVDIPVLFGKSSLGQFELYHDGALFVFDIDYTDGSYTHVHPIDVPTAIDWISVFMEGTLKL